MKRIWIWCKRFRKRKGYGVHSPFAFAFIRGVVNERGAYYAYRELDARRLLPWSRSYSERKIRRLLFRLANAVQPDFVLDVCTTANEETLRYLQAGCFTASVQRADGQSLSAICALLQSVAHVGLLHLANTPYYKEVYEAALTKADAQTLFVIDGIWRTKAMRQWWREVVADQRAVLTFDLYDVGLVFFNPKLNKQHYIVNF